MLKIRSIGAAASLALAAAAFAQPAVFTDLGDLSLTSSNGTINVTLLSATDVQWYRAVLPAASAAAGYVDIWTNGPGDITDTEIGVYTNTGALRATDDDDMAGFASALSFGLTTPTRPGTAGIAPYAGAGTAYNGRDGVLAAGTYYIAFVHYNATFGAADYTVTTTYAGPQRTGTLNYAIVIPTGPTNPSGTAAHSPTSGLAGSSFTATVTVTGGTNPNSTGITVVADASAVGAGSVNLLDDGVGADATAGDNIFSATINTSAATAPGLQTVTYAIADAESRTGSTSATYNIIAPPPANDECANATTAVVGTNAFDSAGATTDGTACTGGSDVWFVFNPGAQGGTGSIETCGLASFDTVLSVHSACGAAFTACNDDNCGLQSRLAGLTFDANTNYYIRVAGFGGQTGAGSFLIDFTQGTPPSGTAPNISGAANSAGLIAVTVTPGTLPPSTGLTVTADTTSIGGTTGTMLFDDGTNGDVTANDNVFSLAITLPGTDGIYNVSYVVADAEARSTPGGLTVTVATPADWTEIGDAGQVVATAQVPEGSGPLNTIDGSVGADEQADMYRISICDFTTFTATTSSVQTGGTDTQLFLFDLTGAGVQMNDDQTGLQSGFANEFVTANGIYYIAVSRYDNDPTNAAAEEIWADVPFGTVRQPDGVGATDPVVAGWTALATAPFNYRLTMTGACFPSCAADFNADGVVDFFDYLDFVDAFSNNDPSADFNNDSIVDFFDYLDFVDAFAAGC